MPTPIPESPQAERAPSPAAAGVDGATLAAHSAPPHAEPEQIGPYRILEKIGEGGMGIVYKAEQKQPVRRLVALKVIKLGMDTREVIARFEAERQALALMSHPNVAKVFEAGATEQGRPFFAMEFVAGIPLVRYCDECRLTTRERLELFIQVCQAVQHAHQKGIIHRDLKPSNILVTHFDGKPVPKVIDFGIAKAANQALTDRTLYTRTGSLIGTPEYMSPEQALTSGLDVDTRTDIYSLGVILYELLTGTLPLDPNTLHQASPERMAQIIKTAEPPRPSTRLSMLGAGNTSSTPSKATLSDVASLRRCDPRSLRRELRGDLDWIVLKAMEKDRTRRYETANGLAMDIRRHLDNEPIYARPPTTRYRMSKFIRKHRVGVSAAMTVVLALGVGLTLATYGLLQARHDRDAARRAEQNQAALRHTAEIATADASETSRIMARLFTDDGPHQFDLATRRLDSGWLADQPDTQADLRITLVMVGMNYPSQINAAEVKRHLTAAVDLVPRLGDARRNDVAGEAHYYLGMLADREKDLPVAEREYRQARGAFRAAAANSYPYGQTLLRLASLRKQQGDQAEFRTFLFEAIAQSIRHNQPFVDGSRDDTVHLKHGIGLARIGQFQQALAQWDVATGLTSMDQTAWYLRGCLLAYLDDPERYRANCRGMLDQWGDAPDFTSLDRVAKTSLIRPDSKIDLAKLRNMTDRAQAVANPGRQEAWGQLIAGMARYRSADFTGCVEAMEQCNSAVGADVYPVRSATADLFAAMAHHQMGHADAARSAFDAAERTIKTLPKAGEADLADNAAINLEDWLIAHVVYREAAQTLKAPAAASTRPAP